MVCVPWQTIFMLICGLLIQHDCVLCSYRLWQSVWKAWMQYVQAAKEKRRKTETATKFGEYLQLHHLCGGICHHSALLLCSLAEAETACMEDMVWVCVGEEGEEKSAARRGPVDCNQDSEVGKSRGQNWTFSCCSRTFTFNFSTCILPDLRAT